MKKIIISALAIVAMAGCQKQKSSDVNDSVAVNFSSVALDTRLSDSGSEWIEGDSIGIFMTSEGVTSSFTRSNVQYVALTGGLSTTDFVVEAQNDPIVYPYDGDVDFYAYYPYSSSLVDSYTVDVTTAATTPDFMVASYMGANKNVDDVEFSFDHKLSKLQLVIASRDNIASLDDIEVAIGGVSMQVDYSIITGEQLQGSIVASDGNPIALNILKDDPDGEGNVLGVVASAILIPETVASGVITITVAGRSFTLSLAADTELTVGNIHRYYISVGEDYAKFDGDNDIVTWDDGDVDTDTLFSDFIWNHGGLS